MPRTREEIIAHADALAKRLEDYEPRQEDRRDPMYLHALREAATFHAQVERQIADAVAAARAGGYSWALIGAQLGTSGQAARQRYGSAESAEPAKPAAAKRAPAKKAPAKKAARASVTKIAGQRTTVTKSIRSAQSGRIAARTDKKIK